MKLPDKNICFNWQYLFRLLHFLTSLARYVNGHKITQTVAYKLLQDFTLQTNKKLKS